MITTENLQICYDKLYVYDVEQGAWEQEPNGVEANARHVLTHLTKDLINKDFSDPETLQKEIVPDGMQYALRFARWAGAEVQEIHPQTIKLVQSIKLARRLGVEVNLASWMNATGELASHLHECDHASKREDELLSRKASLINVARYLMVSTQVSSDENQIDVVSAFNKRLNNLRIRFNIPSPEV